MLEMNIMILDHKDMWSDINILHNSQCMQIHISNNQTDTQSSCMSSITMHYIKHSHQCVTNFVSFTNSLFVNSHLSTEKILSP